MEDKRFIAPEHRNIPNHDQYRCTLCYVFADFITKWVTDTKAEHANKAWIDYNNINDAYAFMYGSYLRWKKSRDGGYKLSGFVSDEAWSQ